MMVDSSEAVARPFVEFILWRVIEDGYKDLPASGSR
jgi:hypothetical protein